MNNLARNIGIWYYDKKWAEELYEEILNGYPRYSLFRIYRDKLEIKLTDGTLIRFFKNTTSNRGMALTDSYIQDGMDYTSFYQLISPATKIGARGMYIINNYDDIRHPKDVKHYYFEKNWNGIDENSTTNKWTN